MVRAMVDMGAMDQEEVMVLQPMDNNTVRIHPGKFEIERPH